MTHGHVRSYEITRDRERSYEIRSEYDGASNEEEGTGGQREHHRGEQSELGRQRGVGFGLRASEKVRQHTCQRRDIRERTALFWEASYRKCLTQNSREVPCWEVTRECETVPQENAKKDNVI